MKLPSRMIDLSSPLDNDTVYDPPFMRPKIEYVAHADTAPLLAEIFTGLRREDLPDGEGWAIEHVQLSSHNGTHMAKHMHKNGVKHVRHFNKGNGHKVAGTVNKFVSAKPATRSGNN